MRTGSHKRLDLGLGYRLSELRTGCLSRGTAPADQDNKSCISQYPPAGTLPHGVTTGYTQVRSLYYYYHLIKAIYSIDSVVSDRGRVAIKIAHRVGSLLTGLIVAKTIRPLIGLIGPWIDQSGASESNKALFNVIKLIIERIPIRLLGVAVTLWLNYHAFVPYAQAYLLINGVLHAPVKYKLNGPHLDPLSFNVYVKEESPNWIGKLFVQKLVRWTAPHDYRKIDFNSSAYNTSWVPAIQNAMLHTDVFPLPRVRMFQYSQSCAKLFADSTIEIARNDNRMTTSDVTSHFVTLCKRWGMVPYFRQMSLSNQKHGYDGDRTYYWAADLETVEQVSYYEHNHADCFINVDYHLDMPTVLSNINHTALILTICPLTLGSFEYPKYRFLDDNVIEFTTEGGKTYRHRLWDYNHDHISVSNRIEGGEYLRIFKCTRKAQGVMQLVSLNLCAEYFIRDDEDANKYKIDFVPLTRFSVSAGNGYNAIIDAEKKQISICKSGSYSAVQISLKLHDTLVALSTNIVHGSITAASIKQYLDKRGDADCDAQLLTPFYRTLVNFTPMKVPKSHAVMMYTIKPDKTVLEHKVGLVAYGNPLLHGTYAPTLTASNREVGIEERVTKPQIKAANVKMTNEFEEYIHEFTTFVTAGTGNLVPCDMDRVYEQQNKRTQIQLLDKAGYDLESKRVTKSHTKIEPYQKPSASRVISTITPRDKAAYSCYLYPVGDWLKTQKWYAFGMSPIGVAERVYEVCKDADTIVNTDYSKWDGHVSVILREMEEQLMLKLFNPKYHTQMLDLMRAQYNIPGILDLETRYWPGTSRLSGSPETSAFNSIGNAFIAYCTLRRSGKSIPRAMLCLGLYGGDDGITANMDPTIYVQTASDMGQSLKVERVTERGKFGVSFLSRYYGPRIWYGDINSMCDLRRQLAKFHCTTRLPQGYTDEMKAAEKARSFLVNDPYTPILSDYCRRILKFFGNLKSDDLLRESVQSYTVKALGTTPENAYPNECEFFELYLSEYLPAFNYKEFVNWLLESNAGNILQPPLLMDIELPEVSMPTLIDDVYYDGEEKTPQDEKVRVDNILENKEDITDKVASKAVPASKQSVEETVKRDAPALQENEAKDYVAMLDRYSTPERVDNLRLTSEIDRRAVYYSRLSKAQLDLLEYCRLHVDAFDECELTHGQEDVMIDTSWHINHDLKSVVFNDIAEMAVTMDSRSTIDYSILDELEELYKDEFGAFDWIRKSSKYVTWRKKEQL